ncbi:MAG: HemK/PrmC family methyltransferase [Chloroflexota bacterium]|nr:HemK/PrmC family methyltransferase [Chloroflexota bacterium]
METIYAALRHARERLAPVSESAETDVQVLLCDVLNVDRAYLFTHPEHLLTEDQVATYGMFVERCAAGEPLPYVRGKQAWYDREFVISPAVLIPRPETELLLEQALQWSAARPSGQAIDVGMGSGILAVTFAAHRPTWDVIALDASPAALAIAQQNAARHGVSERVAFYESDLLSFVLGSEFSVHSSQFTTQYAIQSTEPRTQNPQLRTEHSLLIMANLPYIPTVDLPALRVSQHEPMLALDGGADGLMLIRRLLVQVGEVWSKGDVNGSEHHESRPYSTPQIPRNMLVLLEIEARQGAAVAALAAQHIPAASVDVLRDYAGHDRIVRIEVSAR